MLSTPPSQQLAAHALLPGWCQLPGTLCRCTAVCQPQGLWASHDSTLVHVDRWPSLVAGDAPTWPATGTGWGCPRMAATQQTGCPPLLTTPASSSPQLAQAGDGPVIAATQQSGWPPLVDSSIKQQQSKPPGSSYPAGAPWDREDHQHSLPGSPAAGPLLQGCSAGAECLG